VERLVIQNADLSIVVIDPEAKMDEIGKMAEEMGGFVVSKNVYQTTTGNNIRVPAGNITVRVPAEQPGRGARADQSGRRRSAEREPLRPGRNPRICGLDNPA
jgi:hypothetical protein